MWDSDISSTQASCSMDLINGVMNVVAPLMTFTALFFFLPPYYLLKFLLYVLRSVFSEKVAGKVVVIAGASSGIARRRESLREVAERALLLGSPDAIAVRADISRVVNHLVNVAGETPATLFEETPDVTKLAPAMDINFWGYVYTTHFAVPHLRKSRGKIIAIASSAAWLNVPRLSFYGASKAAVISFYETLRVELGSDIGITIVTPELIESEMTKGKFLDKEGRLVVNQVIRDVIIGPTPIEKVGKGAEAIVNSACRGDKYLTDIEQQYVLLRDSSVAQPLTVSVSTGCGSKGGSKQADPGFDWVEESLSIGVFTLYFGPPPGEPFLGLQSSWIDYPSEGSQGRPASKMEYKQKFQEELGS
ncbi:hypothetical protein RJ639_010209 [Escallonia herrerae]|uniref:Uncharacterized protein n=1 Tax=Escallonia herrerae TaxID=1293975 RepID=A0AA89AWA3_9ASTE|nr:hypothetical protein RJ639_010209 [Escallonia herrerae]